MTVTVQAFFKRDHLGAGPHLLDATLEQQALQLRVHGQPHKDRLVDLRPGLVHRSVHDVDLNTPLDRLGDNHLEDQAVADLQACSRKFLYINAFKLSLLKMANHFKNSKPW